jgi:hypothetical protein
MRVPQVDEEFVGEHIIDWFGLLLYFVQVEDVKVVEVHPLRNAALTRNFLAKGNADLVIWMGQLLRQVDRAKTLTG